MVVEITSKPILISSVGGLRQRGAPVRMRKNHTLRANAVTLAHFLRASPRKYRGWGWRASPPSPRGSYTTADSPAHQLAVPRMRNAPRVHTSEPSARMRSEGCGTWFVVCLFVCISVCPLPRFLRIYAMTSDTNGSSLHWLHLHNYCVRKLCVKTK